MQLFNKKISLDKEEVLKLLNYIGFDTKKIVKEFEFKRDHTNSYITGGFYILTANSKGLIYKITLNYEHNGPRYEQVVNSEYEAPNFEKSWTEKYKKEHNKEIVY
ncbi:hypothetical protein K9L67_00260 [Candidatus Woesearchaeota archaeon]|nr:hypothetical protein [Candidatus Woesearchaeota archaeon]MCF7900639.1 hypothetical protein [Candidatus Woesearchaeota archaeon]MCF8013479.1 hypothetical protein [Candidatus Woesearchaeota archaeon]